MEANEQPVAGFSVAGVEQDESPTLGKLAAALSKAQGEFRPAHKDSKNPHLGSSYADLTSVWEACRKPLSENGLAVMQPITTTDTGVIVETLLVHSSGEFIRRRLEMKIEVRVSREGKSQPWTWAFGSAVSYSRRYALSSLIGLTSGDDDDGASSTAEGPSRPAPAQRKTEQVKEQLKAKAASANGAKPAPMDETPRGRVSAMLDAAGLTDPLSRIALVKAATGKDKAKDLSEDDVARVQQAISDRRAQEVGVV